MVLTSEYLKIMCGKKIRIVLIKKKKEKEKEKEKKNCKYSDCASIAFTLSFLQGIPLYDSDRPCLV
jgi:hypothetical protein